VFASCGGEVSTSQAKLETEEFDTLAAEAISTSQAEPRTDELDALAVEAIELYEQIAERVADIPPEDIERVLMGEIHEQEVLRMDEGEYETLLRELEYLAERGAVCG
jgi:predicted transcriptional regulator